MKMEPSELMAIIETVARDTRRAVAVERLEVSTSAAQRVVNELVVDVGALVQAVGEAGPAVPRRMLDAVAAIADRLSVDMPWKES